jgi:vitamin B12 transporter
MNDKTNLLGILFLSISIIGFAQQELDSTNIQQLDEIVITDSKFNLKRENSGKVITKITQNQIEQQQGRSIAEIINATSGIEINGTKSYAGQNLNYYVRGGRNRQVLILIDGIALTDASQIANDYDLRLLNTNQVESIEVLKGASSTLYGSGAATAVINIRLKGASKREIAASFRSIIGSSKAQEDNTYNAEDFRNSVSLNGTLNKFSYLASFENQFTNGMSALSSGIEPDKDVFNAINGNFKMGYQFSKSFKVDAYASFDDFKADFDDTNSGQEIEDMSSTNQHRIGLSTEIKYNKGSINLNIANNKTNREIISSYPAIYNAESLIGDLYNRYQIESNIYTVLGVNFQQNNMESFVIPFGSKNLEQNIDPIEAKFTIVDPYLNVVYISKFGLNINTGMRLNNHSEYGSNLVYSLNPSFKKDVSFGYIKGLASYSTAYITPSLYQLFEPTYGNPELSPEENATVEFGFEVNFKNKGTLSLVYFNRNETNFINFIDLGNFVYQYNNIDKSFNANGLEFLANYQFSNQVRINSNTTFTKVGETLNLRIPEIKINASLFYEPTEKTRMSLTYQFNDERRDAVFNNLTFAAEDILLKKYNLFDFYISQKFLNNKLLLFFNITNIFNENYQELSGYTTRGRNIQIGMNINL